MPPRARRLHPAISLVTCRATGGESGCSLLEQKGRSSVQLAGNNVGPRQHSSLPSSGPAADLHRVVACCLRCRHPHRLGVRPIPRGHARLAVPQSGVGHPRGGVPRANKLQARPGPQVSRRAARWCSMRHKRGGCRRRAAAPRRRSPRPTRLAAAADSGRTIAPLLQGRRMGPQLPLLLLLASVSCASAAPTVCPTLPAAPAGTRRFALTAAPYAGAWQSLAYNGSKWGPELRVKLGDTVEVTVANDGIEVRSGPSAGLPPEPEHTLPHGRLRLPAVPRPPTHPPRRPHRRRCPRRPALRCTGTGSTCQTLLGRTAHRA